MTIDILGIDLAKNVFQLHGVNRKGNAVFKRRIMRDQLLSVLAGIEPCTIAIEAWVASAEVVEIPISIGV